MICRSMSRPARLLPAPRFLGHEDELLAYLRMRWPSELLPNQYGI
jgi:hypothetical protein